jgi:hypothetical protein
MVRIVAGMLVRMVGMVVIVRVGVRMTVLVAGKEDDAFHRAEKRLPVEAEVEHRAEKHIAGDSGETVEIERFHQETSVYEVHNAAIVSSVARNTLAV